MTPRAVLLCGPTAGGKTALAHEVWTPGVHLINADSRLVYRGMDIGTAKPTPLERARFPWELIDITGPGESFTAQMFLDGVCESLKDMRPGLLVGGTPFYLDVLKNGLFKGATTPEAAKQVREWELGGGLARLQEEVKTRDPAFFERVDQQNGRRLARALEAMLSTGESITHLRASRKVPDLKCLPVVLVPPRNTVYNRIEARANAMVDNGFFQEVAGLLKMGFQPTSPAFTGIGYREACEYLSGRLSKDAFVTRLVERTRQLARRQITWFRRFDPAVFLETEPPAVPRDDRDQWLDTLPLWSGEGSLPPGAVRVEASGRLGKVLRHIMEVWYVS